MFAVRGGRFAEGRATIRRAIELAESFEAPENANSAAVGLAFALADSGWAEEAAELAGKSLERSRDLQTLSGVAVLMSRLGRLEEAEAAIAELTERWPQDTIVNEVTVPVSRALQALLAGDAAGAIERLEPSRPYERAFLTVLQVRGQAYLASGRTEDAVSTFEQLASHDTVFPTWHIHYLARLWVAQANLADGDIDAARTAYQDFFALMKDADEGIPLIEKARAEYETIPGVKG